MDDPKANARLDEPEAARTILESVTDAFFLLDREFRFAYLNGTAQKLLRRTDLVGKHIWTEFPAALGTDFERAYTRAMHDGVRVEFVEHYPAPLEGWFEVRAYPSERGVAVYFHDVTARRLADAEYERSRAQLELVVRGAEVGIWFCPLPFDDLVWDDKVKEHFHLAPDAHVTIETFYERLHPDDRERTRAAIDASVRERHHYDIDYRTVSPDGTQTKWIRAIGRAFYAADGSPIRFDGITIDTSERKRAELALRESEQRHRLAVRATNDAVWDWELASDRVEWNDALTTLFGLTNTLTNSAAWVDRIHPEDRARVEKSIHGVIDAPSLAQWSAEYRFMRTDGTFADVLDRGSVLRDANGVATRLIGAMQDLSERKQAERYRELMMEAERAARSEAERQSRMKDEFLATLSHELRTPLNAILGWSEILLAQRDGGQLAKAAEVIARNARAQSRIIDELLDMSRMLSGKLHVDVERTLLEPLLGAALDTIRPTANAKGVALKLSLPTTTDSWILGDVARLQQALSNLLTNAVKFTPSGSTVELLLERDGRELDIVVRDEGEGIEAEFLPHVFDRFRQADGSISRRHGGLGLGLAIVKQIAELHGGSVRAASAGLGLGATFTLRLPAASAADATTRGAPVTPRTLRAAGDPMLTLTGVRVLVVDDEPDARSLVCRVLEDRGAEVTEASRSQEAFDRLRIGAFDVLVSDIGMPGEDGYTLIQRVRALPAAENGRVPAVAMTAYARTEDRVRAVKAGFSFHVPKPIDLHELVTIVAAATGRGEPPSPAAKP